MKQKLQNLEFSLLNPKQKARAIQTAKLPKSLGYATEIKNLFINQNQDDVSSSLWNLLVVLKPKKLINRLSQELNCNTNPANVHFALLEFINNNSN
ncbi:MAG: hypothetical protein ACRC6O_13420 [Flavobacterium sp.]